MIKYYISFSKKPSNLIFQIIIFFIIIPILITFALGGGIKEKFIYFIIFFLVIVFIAECTFLFLYRLFAGTHYKFLKKKEFSKLVFEPHPYLPFILKKKFKHEMDVKEINYPLNKNVSIPELTSNNLGHYNGEKGDREIIIPKPKNLTRINCLGGSTTGNYVKEKDRIYSYPLELERILKNNTQKNVEVNNCGQGGYNSADIFVRYALQGINTNPNYIIIYHAYNDIRSYLTPDFSSDYLHSRKNLGEVCWRYYLGSKLPNLPINFINYLTNKFLFPFDERTTILEVLAKNKIDIDRDYSLGLKTYERNIQHIIDLSLNNNIKVILSTFCFYLYSEIQDNPLHKLYQKIVSEENEIMKNLAKKNNLILVDASALIPQDNSNFLDSAHFTSKGMNLLAKCFAEKIKIE
jgi:lysophospholipase L1-like esterase